MFEQFKMNAIEVIMNAQKQARLLKQNVVGTEHILIGLCDKKLKTFEILNNLNLNTENILIEIEKNIGEKFETSPEIIPFSPNAKELLEISAYVAKKRLEPITELHLLLALLNTDGKHILIFEDLNVDIEKIKTNTISELENIEMKFDNICNSHIIFLGYCLFITFIVLFSCFVLNNLISNLRFGYNELFSMLGIIISTFFVRDFFIFKFGVGRIQLKFLKLIRIICLVIGTLFISILALTILIYGLVTLGKYNYLIN